MINNIKNSFVDICGYISYMCRRLIKFWLVFLILIIVCYLVYKFIPKDIANNFWGVIISIIAAVLFEGYRSYRKNLMEKRIIKSCIFDFFSDLKSFCFQYHILGTTFIDIAHYSDYEKNPITPYMTIIEKLEKTKEVFEKFDSLPQTDPNKINDKFFNIGIEGYKYFITVMREVFLTLDKKLDIANIHSEDYILILRFHSIYNISSSIINNSKYPDCLKSKNVLLVFPPLVFYIQDLLDFCEYSKKYISEDEFNKFISFR